ncbi:MAG: hypothetical protein ACLGIJ_09115 [Candidatus Limnocylindria bacterium]
MTRLAAARRMSWGFADQALSSLTNFAVGVLVARSVDPESFGAFSVAFTTYTVALITSRALASEPFMVRHSATSNADWRTAARGSSGLAVSVGVAAGILVALIGLLVGGTVGVAFLSLAVVLPGLLAQDMWRFAYIARGKPHLAFILDLAWLALLAPGLLLLDALDSTTLAWPIIIWGGAGGITAAAAHIASRTMPTMWAAIGWIRHHHDLGGRYVVEALVSLGAIQISTYALVAISGLVAAGALRGGQLLIGPMQVMLIGISITAVPEGVRLTRRGGPSSLRRPAVIVSSLMAAATLAWAAIVSVLPEPAGRALLGETWPLAREVVLPLALAYAVAGFGLGPGVGLRVLADARRSVRARTVDAMAQTIGGVAGAWQLGAVGTALGLAGGGLVGATAHWLAFLASVRSALRGTPAPGVEPQDDAHPRL